MYLSSLRWDKDMLHTTYESTYMLQAYSKPINIKQVISQLTLLDGLNCIYCILCILC